MGLRTGILVQDVIVDLSRPIRVCKVHHPIAPAIRVLDRKWADIWRAALKRVEYNSLRRAQPFISPNDCVDIIVTRESENGFGSDVVVENVRVLAIDQIYSETEDGAVVGSTATLELTSTQARSVALSVASGDVSLALRSIADTEGGARFAGVDAGSDEGVGSTVRVFRYGSEQRVALGGRTQ